MEKKIIVAPEKSDTINLNDVPKGTPIFGRVKNTGKLKAMVRKEEDGYITRTELDAGCSGFHDTLEECLNHDSQYYDFFVDL